MSDKRPNSKHKIDRRLNCNLWGRPKSPFNTRQTGPGMHGARRPKPTDYGVQLMAKQKMKGYYANIGERKFHRYYEEAVRLKGDTGENLIGLLERRLDAVCYRAKFVPTIFAARQLVSHGHVTVNGKRVTIGSYQVREGDKIELTEKARGMALTIAALDSAERDVPDYIEVDAKAGKATFIRTPKLEDVPFPVQMEPHLVVEFYSR
jgi:small subunit ribosomal protein S4